MDAPTHGPSSVLQKLLDHIATTAPNSDVDRVRLALATAVAQVPDAILRATLTDRLDAAVGSRFPVRAGEHSSDSCVQMIRSGDSILNACLFSRNFPASLVDLAHRKSFWRFVLAAVHRQRSLARPDGDGSACIAGLDENEDYWDLLCSMMRLAWEEYGSPFGAAVHEDLVAFLATVADELSYLIRKQGIPTGSSFSSGVSDSSHSSSSASASASASSSSTKSITPTPSSKPGSTDQTGSLSDRILSSSLWSTIQSVVFFSLLSSSDTHSIAQLRSLVLFPLCRHLLAVQLSRAHSTPIPRWPTKSLTLALVQACDGDAKLLVQCWSDPDIVRFVSDPTIAKTEPVATTIGILYGSLNRLASSDVTPFFRNTVFALRALVAVKTCESWWSRFGRNSARTSQVAQIYKYIVQNRIQPHCLGFLNEWSSVWAPAAHDAHPHSKQPKDVLGAIKSMLMRVTTAQPLQRAVETFVRRPTNPLARLSGADSSSSHTDDSTESQSTPSAAGLAALSDDMLFFVDDRGSGETVPSHTSGGDDDADGGAESADDHGHAASADNSLPAGLEINSRIDRLLEAIRHSGNAAADHSDGSDDEGDDESSARSLSEAAHDVSSRSQDGDGTDPVPVFDEVNSLVTATGEDESTVVETVSPSTPSSEQQGTKSKRKSTTKGSTPTPTQKRTKRS